MTPLKPKEQRVLDYLKEKIAQMGYAPSVREICADLKMKSTSSAHMYIERLASKGYIIRENGKSRTMIIAEDEAKSKLKANEYSVPVLGQVAAGAPIFANENFEKFISFSTDKNYDETKLFALNVKGESMREIGILNGDIVVVEKREYADNGEIVVAMIDDEATVKRFFKEDGVFRLQPENKDMEPIIVPEVSILGKVVASVRYY